jgi:hypothetical protein
LLEQQERTKPAKRRRSRLKPNQPGRTLADRSRGRCAVQHSIAFIFPRSDNQPISGAI